MLGAGHGEMEPPVRRTERQPVYFDPPLALQRQQWLLQQISQHGHASVMELGCGDGPLIKALCNPPLWLDACDEWKQWFVSQTGVHQHVHAFVEGPLTIAPHKLVAVDIDSKPLEALRTHLEAEKSKSSSLPRLGHALDVTLVCSDFARLTASHFGHMDVVVASEVIEHLHQDSLSTVGSVILGRLRPKHFLVTTPNYSFNAKFSNRESTSFLDPTGRTNRVFRHDDHKFEWTMEEFSDWCSDLALTYGYRVTIGGVGRVLYRDRDAQEECSDEDDATVYASQTAIFEQVHEPRESIDTDQTTETQIVFQHTFPAHTSPTGNDEDIVWEANEVAFAINRFPPFEDMSTFRAKVWDIWMDDHVRTMCSGRLEAFLPPSLCRILNTEGEAAVGERANSKLRFLEMDGSEVFMVFRNDEGQSLQESSNEESLDGQKEER